MGDKYFFYCQILLKMHNLRLNSEHCKNRSRPRFCPLPLRCSGWSKLELKVRKAYLAYSLDGDGKYFSARFIHENQPTPSLGKPLVRVPSFLMVVGKILHILFHRLPHWPASLLCRFWRVYKISYTTIVETIKQEKHHFLKTYIFPLIIFPLWM